MYINNIYLSTLEPAAIKQQIEHGALNPYADSVLASAALVQLRAGLEEVTTSTRRQNSEGVAAAHTRVRGVDARRMEGDVVGSTDAKSSSASTAAIAVRASAAAEAVRLAGPENARVTSTEARRPPPGPSASHKIATSAPATGGDVFPKPDPVESKCDQSCMAATSMAFSPTIPTRPIWPIWRVHASDLFGRNPAHASLQALGQPPAYVPPARPTSCVDALAAAGSPAKVLDAVRASARLAQHKKWMRSAVTGLRSRQRRCQHQLARLKRLRALGSASHPRNLDSHHRAGQSRTLRGRVHSCTDTGEHLDSVSRLLEEMQVEVTSYLSLAHLSPKCVLFHLLHLHIKQVTRLKSFNMIE